MRQPAYLALMELDIHHDVATGCFTAACEGRTAELYYAPAGEGVLDFRSTFVPPELRGRGIGQRLVRHALEHARVRGMRVRPSCWFVKSVAERDEVYRSLLVR